MGRTKDTMPFLLRPKRSLVARLEKLANQYGWDTGNQVAVEILETFSEFWAEGEQARETAIRDRQESWRAAIQAQLQSVPSAKAKMTPCVFCRKESLAGICEICRQELTSEPKMAQNKLNDLPYGAIHLNDEGTVIAYNKAEEDLSRISHKKIIGKNFFTQIAPCADVQEFRGKYDAFLHGNEPSQEFSFTYKFPGRTVQVLIKLLRIHPHNALVISRKVETQRHRKRA